MAPTSRIERVRTADGELDTQVGLPESGSGPGIDLRARDFVIDGSDGVWTRLTSILGTRRSLAKGADWR